MAKYDEILLEAYESYSENEITKEEIDAIKEAVEEKKYNDFLIEHDMGSEEVDEESLNESVEALASELDSLRLSVYEAYEKGLISEEDKNVFLENLNIDEYEYQENAVTNAVMRNAVRAKNAATTVAGKVKDTAGAIKNKVGNAVSDKLSDIKGLREKKQGFSKIFAKLDELKKEWKSLRGADNPDDRDKAAIAMKKYLAALAYVDSALKAAHDADEISDSEFSKYSDKIHLRRAAVASEKV